MEFKGLNEIREEYLKFFESEGHLRMDSFSLIPNNDPSLLLINAGMAPLKKYFTGEETPPRKRVTTCQKCIRTPDIDNVGKTARHGTFFEMLGNFSFGDYFKKEATAWAWEFVTEVMKMPVDKLWVSIYEEDDEAFEIWNKNVGVAADRIVRMGKEDNFWEIGQGPCGPCSEIYFDRGEAFGCGKDDCKVGCECDRFVEFWNLVFTQFDKDENGVYHKLKNPNIDTGMGLERLAAIMQGVKTLFEVDTIRKILDEVCKISNEEYGKNPEADVSIRVITDHIRSITFMISDGVIPTNEGRGYVLRRLLRRAARHGKMLGIKDKFLYLLCETVIDESKDAYKELELKRDFIKSVIKTEEDKFSETLDQGLVILNNLIDNSNENGVLSGEDAFRLYDTYGFPLDLTKEILSEKNMTVDEDKFKSLMDKQREKSRESRGDNDSAGWDENSTFDFKDVKSTIFTGYDEIECDSKILKVIKKDSEENSIIIITEKTCFYAESGGQAGDKGKIISKNASGEVTDTRKANNDIYLHYVNIKSGEFNIGDEVKLLVDKDLRAAVSRNHSVTHLLHKALRDTLGAHVAQAGSLVTPERLRFDFSHISALSKEELNKIETDVNNAILKGLDISISVVDYKRALDMGATALFNEKYKDNVRVVKMGDYSMELCGGTHLKNTAQAGLFKIISETGIAAGVRRIEAVTGLNVLNLIYEKENLILDTAMHLKSSPNDISIKANSLIEENKKLNKEIESLKAKIAAGSINNIINKAVSIGGVNIIIDKIDGADMGTLRTMGDKIKDNSENVFALIAGVSDNKINFVCVADKKLMSKGLHCGNIIKEVAKITGGGGGGRPDSAQAGGTDLTKLDTALKNAMDIIKGILE